MDSFTTILTGTECELEITSFSLDELNLIESYLEIGRCFTEICQLFDMFRFNLLNMKHYFTLNCNDTTKRNLDFESSDIIAINALVTNYLSSAKTLTDSIEVFIKEKMSKCDHEKFKKEHISKEYDDCFSYRFLYFLRNYSQHGHPPVSLATDRLSFDIGQISKTPNFNFSLKEKNMLDNIKNEIRERGGYERIVFTYYLNDSKHYSPSFTLQTARSRHTFFGELFLNHPTLTFGELPASGSLHRNIVFFNVNLLFRGNTIQAIYSVFAHHLSLISKI